MSWLKQLPLRAAVALVSSLALPLNLPAQRAAAQPASDSGKRHNVIIFVADGLRRGSVTAEDMPTFLKLRTEGVDFRNSHSVFPTFTTANASAIATGHGLGDTGDYSNVIYPGVWLARHEPPSGTGAITPFLENNEILANMNGAFSGNYLGERTLLTAARQSGYNVASVGKLGPTAIQQIEAVGWGSTGSLSTGGAIIVDDFTGQATGLPLPPEILAGLKQQALMPEAPLRSNGFADGIAGNNGFTGDAITPGTRDANRVQQQWFTDVTTKVLLPQFAASEKPFALLFWSRDPDGTQHNQGDSLQQRVPGINGPTAKLALRNADRCLKQLLDWLDAHPAVKATTDVLITSDHGFATVSRREIRSDGTQTTEPSAALEYETGPHEKPEPKGTLPTGFLAVDLGIREHLHVYDSAVRSSTGPSVFAELLIGSERSQHPSTGSALLGEAVQKLDGSDARLIVAANGGSDLIYAPGRDAALVRQTVAVLSQLDYVGGIFVEDSYCPTAADCPGALPLSAIRLVGASHIPRPAIVVAFKVFYATPGDYQTALQVSDTTLQEGQGMHGGFGRDSTWNNMAAIGPDFKHAFVDEAPVGNVDITPTLAKIMGVEIPGVGSLKGRVAREALAGGGTAALTPGKVLVSAPDAAGASTVMEYQEADGVRYLDRGCYVAKGAAKKCE